MTADVDDDYDCQGDCPNCDPVAQPVPFLPAPPSGRAVVDGWEFFYEGDGWTWEGET